MEDRVRLWTLLSALVAPLTFKACLLAWNQATGTLSGGRALRLAACVLALVLLRTQVSFAQKVRFEMRARRLGCKPPIIYPHRELLLGWDWFAESSRALRECTLLDLFARRFNTVGQTHYNLALGRWLLMTAEPENVKSILATDFEAWPIAGPRLWAVLPQLGRRSIFTTNGPEWHAARSMIRPSFVRDQVADFNCFDRHINNLIAAVRERGGPDGKTVDLQELLMLMTMDSSTDFMLGHSTESLLRSSPEAREFLQEFDYVQFESAKRARLGPIMFIVPDRRFNGAIKKIRSFVQLYVSQALAEKGSRKTTSGRSPNSADPNSHDGTGSGRNKTAARSYVFLDELVDSGASEEYVVDQVLSIIIAGRDTTAGAIAGMFYFLARSPRVVDKLRAEIEELGIRDPSWEDLRNMKYLQNVIKEALRLFPPVATNSRSTNKEVILPRGGGPDGNSPLLLPAGTSCRWSSYAIHRRKDIYGPDADEFRPERWEKLRVGWEYTPFSGGPRICIGQQFALTQISYLLFRVMQNFKAIEPRDPSPLRIKVSVTVSLASGCLVGMTPA